MTRKLLLSLGLLLALCSQAFAQPTAGAMFLYGHYQFFSNTGAPLAGGKLCSYAAGSLTPQDTYSDKDIMVPNANPVILNTAGRPWNGANEINLYLSGKAYKFILLTAGTTTDCTTGTTIWTADNVEDLANVFLNTTQSANTVFAGPTTGSAAKPAFRALVAADMLPIPWTVVSTTATGTQDNFAPGISNNTILRCNNATLLTIDGFAAGVTGQHLLVASVGAGQVDFSPQNGSSTAANRLINYATVGVTSLAAGSGTAEFIYDGVTARWRLVAHDQGAWISVAFSAGNFTASGAQTWTLTSGDQTTYKYWLRDRTLSLNLTLSTTSVGGTPSTQLRVTIPDVYTIATTVDAGGVVVSDNGGTTTFGEYLANSAARFIAIFKGDESNWTGATNTTYISFMPVVEIN